MKNGKYNPLANSRFAFYILHFSFCTPSSGFDMTVGKRP